MTEEAYCQIEPEKELGPDAADLVYDHGPLDVWDIEPVMESEPQVDDEQMTVLEERLEADDDLASRVARRIQENRKLKFFEVYVDQGNLAVHLAKAYPDVESSTFSLPEWDFSKKEVREEFVSLLREVSPDFVWIAPPCRKWSAMQRLNRRTAEQVQKLEEERKQERETHLALVPEIAEVSKEQETNYAVEHPHGAESWKSEPLASMRGFYEGICNRCQTGLRYSGPDVEGPVRKQTRIRTTSKEVAEALRLPCTCACQRVPMEGRAHALRSMQNYEPGFVNRAGKAIYAAMDRSWIKKEMMHIMVAEEMTDLQDKNRKITSDEVEMSKTHKHAARSIVEKLHRQLGHPGRDRLVTALRE